MSMFDGDCSMCSLPSDSDWCLTCKKEFGMNKDKNWIETDLSTALHKFTLGYKIECRVNYSIWQFDFSKNNATVILNQRMIERGKWFMCTEN